MSNKAAKPHWLFIRSCKTVIYRSCKRKLAASLCKSSPSKQSSNWQVPVDFPPQSPLITRSFNYYMHTSGGNNLAAPPRFNYQVHAVTQVGPVQKELLALTKFCYWHSRSPKQNHPPAAPPPGNQYWWKWGEDLLPAFSSSLSSKG